MKKKYPCRQGLQIIKRRRSISFLLPAGGSRRQPLLHFDESKGINRPLRYSPNQKSCFEDEQDGNVLREPIEFTDGFKSSQKNPVLQEFLYYHPANGKKFVEVNEEADAAQEIERLNVEVDALIEAKKLSVDQLETISRVLLGVNTETMSTAELRRDLLVFVKRDPQTFMKMINDPMLKLQSNVQLFFDKGLLSFRNKQKRFGIIHLLTKRKC